MCSNAMKLTQNIQRKLQKNKELITNFLQSFQIKSFASFAVDILSCI